MAGILFPVDAHSGAPNYTGQMARQALSALMSGRKSTRPLGSRSGIHAETSATVVSASSTLWTVSPHAGFIDNEASASAGGSLYAFEVAVTGAMTAADVSNQRVDSICIRHDDPSQGDGSSAALPVCVYTAGNPGAPGGGRGAAGGPPNIPARCFELAQITVPPSGGGSPSVSVVAPYVVATGGILPCRSSAEYPTSSSTGRFIHDLSTGALLTWDGTEWAPPLGINATGIAAVTSTGLVNVDAALTGVITVPAVPYPCRVLFHAQGKAGNAASARNISWDWDSLPGSGVSNIVADDASVKITVPGGQYGPVTTMLCMQMAAGVPATARLMYRANGNGFNTGSLAWHRSPVV